MANWEKTLYDVFYSSMQNPNDSIREIKHWVSTLHVIPLTNGTYAVARDPLIPI